MAEITAAAVKALREQTGLPMMDCKRALEEAQGDAAAAIEVLRKAGKKTMEKRAGRETSFGRIAVYTDPAVPVGTMIELRCESAPVAANDDFVRLANDLARQLATGPGAASPEDLLGQPSPSKPGHTLRQQFDDLSNRIREVFRLQRIVRIDATCAAYVHHNGTMGVLLQAEGGKPDVAKDICMQIVSMRPTVVSREELDPALIEKEKVILAQAVESEAAAMQEEAASLRAGTHPACTDRAPEVPTLAANLDRKAENLRKNRDKIAEGRLRELFYARHCLLEQPFVKESKQTVAKVAQASGLKIVRFVHWELGKE